MVVSLFESKLQKAVDAELLQRIDSLEVQERNQDPDLLEFIVIFFSREMADVVCRIIRYKNSGFNLQNTNNQWEMDKETYIRNPYDKESRLLNAFYIDHKIVLITAFRCIMLDKFDLSEKIQVSF